MNNLPHEQQKTIDDLVARFGSMEKAAKEIGYRSGRGLRAAIQNGRIPAARLKLARLVIAATEGADA